MALVESHRVVAWLRVAGRLGVCVSLCRVVAGAAKHQPRFHPDYRSSQRRPLLSAPHSMRSRTVSPALFPRPELHPIPCPHFHTHRRIRSSATDSVRHSGSPAPRPLMTQSRITNSCPVTSVCRERQSAVSQGPGVLQSRVRRPQPRPALSLLPAICLPPLLITFLRMTIEIR